MSLRSACMTACLLTICVGCAREDRWVLTEDHAGDSQWVKGAPDKAKLPPAGKYVSLSQRDGVYYLRNTSSKSTMVATVEITSTDSPKLRTTQYLVLPGSEIQATSAGDAPAKVRLMSVDYQQ